MHTYRLTPLGLWNARAAGHDAEQVIDVLLRYSRYPVPHSLLVDIAEILDRYGRLRLEKHPQHGLVLVTTDRPVLEEVLRSAKVKPMLGARIDDDTVLVHPSERGHLKQTLLKLGWPAEDLAGYVDGEAHPIELSDRTAGSCARTSSRPRTPSGTAVPGSSYCRVVPARRSSARPRWRRPSATTLILVTNTVVGPAVEGRAAQAHQSDRGGDRRVLRARARRSARSRSRRTR